MGVGPTSHGSLSDFMGARPARGGLDYDPGVFCEVDLLALSDPAVVGGARCTPVADAGSDVG